jgi:seryl-tRNA(Sec) selenium transferase
LRDVVPGIPHHGIGRSMKVGKEEIVGLVAALRRYLERDHAAEQQRWQAQLACIAGGLPDVQSTLVAANVPRLRLHVGTRERAIAAIRALDSGEPRVAVAQYGLDQGMLIVNPHVLQPGEEEIVLSRLREVLAAIPPA